MISSRKFKWEFWIDPLNRNLDEVSPTKYHDPKSVGRIDYIDIRDEEGDTALEDVESDFDGHMPDFEYMASKIHAIEPMRVAHTRFGLLTIVESAVAGYHFDFWILHSNVEFTPEDKEIIKEIDGVETVNPMTRYRIKIGFPKSGLFDTAEVKMEVEKSLKERYEISKKPDDLVPFEQSFSDDVVVRVNDKIAELKGNTGHWLLYVLPNGKMEVYESDFISQAYKNKHELFSQSKKLLGGHIFNS